jgi:folate-binding protein YgfZ
MRFIAEIPSRSVLQINGVDAAPFLQGLLSNDVTAATAAQGVYAAFLSPQGKYQHDLFILGADGGFLADVESARRADLLKKLHIYKLRSAVDIADLGQEYKIYALWGAGENPSDNNVKIYPDPRLPQAGWRIIAGVNIAIDTLAQKFSAQIADFAAYDYHRAQLGLPDGSRDMMVDRGILLENGFDELRGISWDKGCYLGQELTARTRYRGLVRKRLVPCVLESEQAQPIAANSVVTLRYQRDALEAGETHSFVAGGNGNPAIVMVLLRLEALTKQQAGHGALYCGEQRIIPRIPGWMELPKIDAA